MEQKWILVNLNKEGLTRIFSYEVGEPGLETGRTWKQDRQEGPSGQDTAGGINKKQQPHLFVFGHLQKFYFHLEKYEQMGIKLSPERAATAWCICVTGKAASRKTLVVVQRFLRCQGLSWF